PFDAASDSARQPAGAPDGESSYVRTDLLRRIAHDIASPTGVSLTVLDEIGNSGGPRPELIAMARRSLKRLMRLSEQLCLASEIESRTLEPELTGVDVRSIIKQALDDAIMIDGRRDVVASCDLPSGPVLIAGDARLLVSMLREIIGNALRLATSRVEVSA